MGIRWVHCIRVAVGALVTRQRHINQTQQRYDQWIATHNLKALCELDTIHEIYNHRDYSR
jgi:hypothetical protein